MVEFPHICRKIWPYEWTYTQIDLSGIKDKTWLSKNVGPWGETWTVLGGRSTPGIGLYTEYGFVDKEQMVLFQLARCNVED